jgi:uncharacterized protein YutE (UPF0331/DUF86 family)
VISSSRRSRAWTAVWRESRRCAPQDLGASFTLLARSGILDDDLADRMRRRTGFRNVAVHEYRRLDPAVLEAIVRTRLGDLRAFAGRMLERAGLGPTDRR